MRNQLIPRSKWPEFFRGFSERHQDWLVTVRVVSASLGSQVEARDLPLEGIVASAQGDDPISIHVGRDASDHVEHEIANPKQIWVELSEEGAEEALDIESADGTKTIVQFRVAPLAQTVDGILQP